MELEDRVRKGVWDLHGTEEVARQQLRTPKIRRPSSLPGVARYGHHISSSSSKHSFEVGERHGKNGYRYVPRGRNMEVLRWWIGKEGDETEKKK